MFWLEFASKPVLPTLEPVVGGINVALEAVIVNPVSCRLGEMVRRHISWVFIEPAPFFPLVGEMFQGLWGLEHSRIVTKHSFEMFVDLRVHEKAHPSLSFKQVYEESVEGNTIDVVEGALRRSDHNMTD